jgi:hypothetical protein
MATFPEIYSSDFSLRRIDGHLVQGPVDAPEFEFQFSSNFDYYRPCSADFIRISSLENAQVVLRTDLASCYWETLKMKCRYILAAANGWKGDFDRSPLPASVPEASLTEIGMIHPPFPPLEQLANNFFLLPALPSLLTIHIKVWQDNSRQLSAWIEKAKARSTGAESS